MTSDSETGRCFEIEITPEMIAAGEEELCCYNSDMLTEEHFIPVLLEVILRAGGYVTVDRY